jgi:Ran GTPase-activating protein (RanGAP) involved in mRNA processing and transport
MNDLQLNFHIRRFEYSLSLYSIQLKFCDFEELTFMHLQILKMHYNQLAEVHLLYLLYMFTFSRDMRTFEFTKQSIKCRNIRFLAQCIRSFTALEVLNLDGNFMIFDSLELVLDAVQTSTLSALTLSTNSCEDDRKTLKLCNVLRMNCNSLKVLNLSGMRLRTGEFESLVAAIGACGHLQCLDMSHNHLHYGCLMDLLRATAECRLQAFNWSGNRLGSAGTFVLASHITHSNVLKTTLTDLKLRMCDVYHGLHHLGIALSLCTTLHTLDLSSNSVFAHEVVNVLESTSITSLDISHNYISDYGMRLIVQRAIRSETLRYLAFNGNHMSRHTISELRRMKRKGRVSMTIPKTACVCGVCTGL